LESNISYIKLSGKKLVIANKLRFIIYDFKDFIVKKGISVGE
jgi:hypothetical protein